MKKFGIAKKIGYDTVHYKSVNNIICTVFVILSVCTHSVLSSRPAAQYYIMTQMLIIFFIWKTWNWCQANTKMQIPVSIAINQMPMFFLQSYNM